MKTKNFARIMLAVLALFVVGVAMAYGQPFTLLHLSSISTATVLPFAFTLSEPLAKALSAEEKAGMELLGSQITTYLKQREEGLLDEKTINAKIKAAWDDTFKSFNVDENFLKGLRETLRLQGLDITAIKEQRGGGEAVKSRFQQIDEWIKSADFKTALKERRPMSLELKAAVPLSERVQTMGTTTGLLPAYAAAPELFTMEIDQTIHYAPLEPLFLWNKLLKGSTNAVIIIWFNRINKEGSAAFTTEYGLRPLLSWTYERKTSEPYKASASVKISNEMMEDAAFIQGEIDRVSKDDLARFLETKVLNGSGDNGEPEGVTNWASAYAGTGLDGKIVAPNNGDAIRASILQLRNNHQIADLLILSPADAAMLDLTKDKNDNYMKQEIDALLKSLTIVESTFILPDKYLMLDTSKYIVKNKGGVKVSTGWGVNQVNLGTALAPEITYKSDYEMGAITLSLDQEFFAYHDQMNETAALYDSFSTVKEALAKEEV